MAQDEDGSTRRGKSTGATRTTVAEPAAGQRSAETSDAASGKETTSTAVQATAGDATDEATADQPAGERSMPGQPQAGHGVPGAGAARTVAIGVGRTVGWVGRGLPGVIRPDRPNGQRLLYYGGLGALAAFGVVDWPVAAAIGAGVWVAGRRGDRTGPAERSDTAERSETAERSDTAERSKTAGQSEAAS